MTHELLREKLPEENAMTQRQYTSGRITMRKAGSQQLTRHRRELDSKGKDPRTSEHRIHLIVWI